MSYPLRTRDRDFAGRLPSDCAPDHSCSERLPETPMHLDGLLADQPLAGGLEPRLGNAHPRTLSVVGTSLLFRSS